MTNPFEELMRAISSVTSIVSTLKNDIEEIKEKSSISDVSDNRYIDKRQAAKIANVSVSTIDNWRRSGRIKPYYFESAVRFHYAEFMEFLNGQKKS